MEVALIIKKEKNYNENPQTPAIYVVCIAKRNRQKKYHNSVV